MDGIEIKPYFEMMKFGVQTLDVDGNFDPVTGHQWEADCWGCNITKEELVKD